MKTPRAWGLDNDHDGVLVAAGVRTVDLVRDWGTPLHVLNIDRLEKTARLFRQCAESAYAGTASVHYALKCNSLSAVIQTIRKAGCNVEVVTPFELELVRRMSFRSDQIVVNGPCKSDRFLNRCLETGVRVIVVDSLDELNALRGITDYLGLKAKVLLRVNPDFVPRGMNDGSATGSRRCAFGFSLKDGELEAAVAAVRECSRIQCVGFHMHLGTGIRDHRDFAKAFRCLSEVMRVARSAANEVRILDVGGGLASPTAREFTSREMLLYQGLGTLPENKHGRRASTIVEYTETISKTVTQYFSHDNLPELLYEPGRCIASQSQFLLLTVHRVKERRGVGKWLITDGGLGTLTLPTFYEHHEILLCNEVSRPKAEKVTIVGPACFAGDIVYRNIRMPSVRPGEILAVMDTGAYFLALESSFGFPLPPVVAVSHGSSAIVRAPQSFDDMASRDLRLIDIPEMEKTS